MSANDVQIGGDHYGGGEYQHWDWVHDCRMSYHAGTASKYVDRWRKKNGPEDLKKAHHYILKAQELGLTGSIQIRDAEYFWRYVIARNHALEDAAVLWYIMKGEWDAASNGIVKLLESVGEQQEAR